MRRRFSIGNLIEKPVNRFPYGKCCADDYYAPILRRCRRKTTILAKFKIKSTGKTGEAAFCQIHSDSNMIIGEPSIYEIIGKEYYHGE